VGTILPQLSLLLVEAVEVEVSLDRRGPARGALAIVLAFQPEVLDFLETGVMDTLLRPRKRVVARRLLLEERAGSAMRS
jgi:hypothetical protein